jgi:hypothetical protein
MASCKNRTVISIPKSSPATLVNLLITLEALNIAKRNSMTAVQMQTLLTWSDGGHNQFNISEKLTQGQVYSISFITILPTPNIAVLLDLPASWQSCKDTCT